MPPVRGSRAYHLVTAAVCWGVVCWLVCAAAGLAVYMLTRSVTYRLMEWWLKIRQTIKVTLWCVLMAWDLYTHRSSW